MKKGRPASWLQRTCPQIAFCFVFALTPLDMLTCCHLNIARYLLQMTKGEMKDRRMHGTKEGA